MFQAFSHPYLSGHTIGSTTPYAMNRRNKLL